MVKKALNKIKDQLSEEEYFLGEDFTSDWLSQTETTSDTVGQLAVDLYQTENEVVIKAPVAGVDTGDIEIDVEPDQVSIQGERKEEREVSDELYHAKECFWGSFARVVALPTEVTPDGARASFKKGILTIRIPKARKTQAVKIKIDE